MDSKLRQVVARVFQIRPETLEPESGPHSIPTWDSAGHINLILTLEQEFGVQFSEDEVVEMISVEAIGAALSLHGITV